jgi:hypothetical protein
MRHHRYGEFQFVAVRFLALPESELSALTPGDPRADALYRRLARFAGSSPRGTIDTPIPLAAERVREASALSVCLQAPASPAG